MKFGAPIWLMVLAAAAPALVWAACRFARARREALKQFAAERLLASLTSNVWNAMRLAKTALFLAGLLLCVAALARPQVGFRWQEVKRKGIDLLFAVDVSKSMLAQDVNPNRLTRAKLAVTDLVEKLEGDRVGLIAFAGSSFLQCPLTLDYDAFRQSLDALDTTVIPKGGTDIASAIREAGEAFSLAGTSQKILVIVTDGEDLEANGIAAAREAAGQGIRIFTVGVGNSAGELIPVPNESGGVEFLKDEKGQPVKSRLDDATLRQIAEATGGAYEPLGRQGEGLEAIYRTGLASIPKQELSARMNRVYLERFQWPLAAAIALLILELMIGDRKKEFAGTRKPRRFRPPPIPKPAAVALLLIACSSAAFASPQSAERAYRKGEFKEAAAQYQAAVEKKPERAELQFNLGAAAYKSGEYASAQAALQKSLKTDHVGLQQNALYNMGNVQYRIGQQTEKSDVQKTIQTWQQSLQSYEQAMSIDPKDEDAKYNYEFVKKKLEELQKQQQQQQKDPQKQDQKNKDQQKQDQQNQPKDQDKDQNKQDSKKDDQAGGSDSQKKDSQDRKPKDQSGSSGQDQDRKKDKPEQKNQSERQNPSGGEPKKPESSPSKPGDSKAQAPKPEPKKEEERAGANPAQEKGGQPGEREPQPLPGQLTREEAKNLLDSLKGDERKMPASMDREGRLLGADEAPRKDW